MVKAPVPPPRLAVKPPPPPAPPAREYLVGRIEQLTAEIRGADPFASARLAKKLDDVVDRLVRTLTDEERETVRNAAIGAPPEVQRLVEIIERLTGETFLS